MLDLGAAELRLQRLHVDEHDERAIHAQRVRSRCHRRAHDVRHATGRRLARGALVDWNNNYGDDDDKCALFHCGNWAKSFLPDIKIATAPILGSTLGVENTYGALEGRTPAGPLTYGRITTADADGCIRAYVGEGELTDDELNTFGTRAVAHVPQLQRLLASRLRQRLRASRGHDAVADRPAFWPRRSANTSAGTRTNTAER